jgi:uncharacterized membrane protein
MNTAAATVRRHWIKVCRAVGVALASVLFAVITLRAGLGMAAIVANGANANTLVVWGNVGQAFGVLTAVLSAFALVVLMITFRMQLRELKNQHDELAQQRDALVRSQRALHRSAEADLRALHVGLIKMALDDAELAMVWPSYYAGQAKEHRRQFLYINLILQQIILKVQISDFTDEEVESHLKYLFRSPIIREYWRETRGPRASLLIRGSAESRFNQMADDIWQEYEAVLACTNSEPGIGPPETGTGQSSDCVPDESAA